MSLGAKHFSMVHAILTPKAMLTFDSESNISAQNLTTAEFLFSTGLHLVGSLCLKMKRPPTIWGTVIKKRARTPPVPLMLAADMTLLH